MSIIAQDEAGALSNAGAEQKDSEFNVNFICKALGSVGLSKHTKDIINHKNKRHVRCEGTTLRARTDQRGCYNRQCRNVVKATRYSEFTFKSVMNRLGKGDDDTDIENRLAKFVEYFKSSSLDVRNGFIFNELPNNIDDSVEYRICRLHRGLDIPFDFIRMWHLGGTGQHKKDIVDQLELIFEIAKGTQREYIQNLIKQVKDTNMQQIQILLQKAAGIFSNTGESSIVNELEDLISSFGDNIGNITKMDVDSV
jgi:hypothetical protein